MFYGASRGLSAILPSIHSLLVHTVHGQEQLTRFDARLAFKEKVCFDLVELHNYVNETLTNVAREAALALALPTNLVRQEDAVGIRARRPVSNRKNDQQRESDQPTRRTSKCPCNTWFLDSRK